MFNLPTRLRGIINRAFVASWKPVVLWMVLATVGCASTKPQGSETIIKDSTSLRVAQRLVAVAVPGDSASLRTRLVFDEATRQFKPVTIFSGTGRTRLAFTLDGFGLVTVSGYSVPYVAQVTVTDTTRTHTRLASTKTVVAVEAPKSRFVKFCIWFTCLAAAASAGWAYTRFFTPFRFF